MEKNQKLVPEEIEESSSLSESEDDRGNRTRDE